MSSRYCSFQAPLFSLYLLLFFSFFLPLLLIHQVSISAGTMCQAFPLAISCLYLLRIFPEVLVEELSCSKQCVWLEAWGDLLAHYVSETRLWYKVKIMLLFRCKCLEKLLCSWRMTWVYKAVSASLHISRFGIRSDSIIL